MTYRTAFALALLAAFTGPAVAAEPQPLLRSFAEEPPPAPDYARPESWAARPGREGAATAVPPGATAAATKAKVDVFYVHPTTDRSKVRWNTNSADAEINGWTDASVIARQASVFSACCRIFAPRYRQATSRAFSARARGDADGDRAYDLAYRDIAAAFAHYLAHDNHGRPFILAGHSQGGYHIARLIETMIDGRPLARRMVAAYVVGFNIPVGAFGTSYKTVPPCATPTQTGCIVQWNSALRTANTAMMGGGSPGHPDKTNLCVNPLTFALARPAAGAEAALGAVPGEPGYGPMAPLRANAVGAACESGVLVVDPASELNLTPLPGGIMHYHDIGLFYADIRANAVARTNAFLARRR